MWRKCVNTLAPLTKLCSAKVEFKWTDVEHNSFIAMKNIVGRDVLFSYPSFSEIFIIYTDTIKTYLRGVISKNGDTITF